MLLRSTKAADIYQIIITQRFNVRDNQRHATNTRNCNFILSPFIYKLGGEQIAPLKLTCLLCLCGVHSQTGNHRLVITNRQQAVLGLDSGIVQLVLPRILEELALCFLCR